MNKRLVITVNNAPIYKIFIRPNLIDKTPPTKPPSIVIIKPKVFTIHAISLLLKPIS